VFRQQFSHTLGVSPNLSKHIGHSSSFILFLTYIYCAPRRHQWIILLVYPCIYYTYPLLELFVCECVVPYTASLFYIHFYLRLCKLESGSRGLGLAFPFSMSTNLYTRAIAHWYGFAPGLLPLVCHARRPRLYTVSRFARGIPNLFENTPLLNFRFGYAL
jgi:hypothetical protein